MTDALLHGAVIIDRSILEIYRYVKNVNAIVEWYPYFTKIEEVEPERGSRVTFRATLSLKPLTNWGPNFKIDLTDYVPGRRISYRSDDVGVTTTVEFQPAMHGTLVTATYSLWGWQAAAFGLFAQPLRLLGNDWLTQCLLSLKRKAEARTVDASPLVFFNYRHAQEYVGGRIYDALCQDFGIGYVFKDFESLKGGRQWREGIDKALKECKVIIAHIDDDWEKEIINRMGKDEPDWVRDELERALNNQGKDVTLIPVFTSSNRDFNMPRRLKQLQDKLPNELKTIKTALANRQGILLRTDPDFRQDLERLLQAVWEVIQSDGM